MNIVSRDECQEFITKDSSTIRELMAPRNSAIVRQSLAEATVHPYASTIAHYHPQTEEIYYILCGDGLIAIENDVSPVKAGDSIGILPGERHQIRNTGRTDLIFLCCCVPSYIDSDTIICSALLDETLPAS